MIRIDFLLKKQTKFLPIKLLLTTQYQKKRKKKIYFIDRLSPVNVDSAFSLANWKNLVFFKKNWAI